MSESVYHPESSLSRERPLIDSALRDAFGTSVQDAPDHVPDPFVLPPADSFPGYDLLEEIHRGGQGVVYRARQRATGRDVAIKLMREGPFAGPRGKARFDREVHVLAHLKHPHIVTIHESATAAGHHYFVMDYIEGEPLDAYVARHDWPVETILRLFARICRAVHAAHLRGVIHRDLKPSNILIDETGEPQILDFGLAKFDSQDGDRSGGADAMTMTGQFVGSLPWASPEQADGATERMDLRTDVYSLGVVLYQLLTGTFPYRVVGPMREVLRHIADAPPARPRSVSPELDDEVETIVLKALEKEPERRYQSAVAFAEDIERYLQRQPILARPSTAAYQLRKLVSRHKLSAWLLATIALLMFVSSIGATVLYRRADRQRAAAEAARDAEVAQRLQAETNLARAKRAESGAMQSAQTANQVSQFLIDLFDISDPTEARGNTITAREILDRGAAHIATELAEQPVVKARLLDVMGIVYRSLGLYDAARPLLEQSLTTYEGQLGSNAPEVGKTLDDLAVLLRQAGDYARAEPLQRRALAIRKAALGNDDADTIASRSNLALLLKAQGRLDEAEALLKQTLEQSRRVLGSQHLRTLLALNNLATVLQAQGHWAEAETYFREALSGDRTSLGEDHPVTLQTQNNLGRVLYEQGRLGEAESLLRGASESLARVMGEEHPTTLKARSNLGLVLQGRGRQQEAADIFRSVMKVRERTLGEEHPDTLQAMTNLALSLHYAGDLEEAEHLYRRALAAQRRTLGSDHPETLTTLSNLGSVLRGLHRFDEAETVLRDALERHRTVLGEQHPNTIVVMNNLALVLKSQGRFDDAADLQRRVLEANRATLGEEHPSTITAASNLASTYKARSDLTQAESVLRQAVDWGLHAHGSPDRSTLVAMNNLAKVLMEQGRAEEAEPFYRQLIDHLQQAPVVSGGIAAIFRGNYGDCLVALGRLSEAEEQLERSLDGMIESRGVRHPRTQKVVRALVNVCEKLNQPNDAAHYRAMIAEPPAP